MDVSDVLRDRLGEPAGFERMAVISTLVHGALFAVLILTPGRWFPSLKPEPKTVMTISLSGGNGGPANGGFSAIGGRAVQAETPPEVKREVVTAPAAKTPEMTVPVETKAPPKAAPKKPTPVVTQ